jgi:predicted dehydrogenase
MNLLVAGCGSIGKRHVRNLTTLSKANGRTVYVYDPNPEALRTVVEETGATPLRSLEDLPAKNIEGAIVAVPNHLHIPVACKLLDLGSSVLIEKPMSHTLEGVDDLISLAHRKRKVLLTGYNLRYHPNLLSAKSKIEAGTIGKVLTGRFYFGYNLALWRPHLDYRKNYGSRKAEGGGVVLDVIHEIDYITWLLGDVKRVGALAGKKSQLEIDTEDVAVIVLEMNSGSLIELHLDYVDLAYDRGFRIVGSKGTLAWDMPSICLKSYEGETKSWSEEKLQFDFNETYLSELKHFIGAIEGEYEPSDDGTIGRRGIEICLAIKRSAETGTFVEL